MASPETGTVFLYCFITQNAYMKQLIKTYGFKAFMCVLAANLLSLYLLAQDSGGAATTTTTTTKTATSETTWYSSPWVWVAGAAVFVLLLVALLKGSGNSGGTTASRTDKVTVTKSTSTD
jgi:hypothetical protein